MPQLNNYKLRPGYGWGPGVTQRKHVAEIGAKNPIMMNEVVVRAFTANYGYQFSNLLKEHTSVREFESDDEYTWKLITSSYKNIPLLEARNEDGNIVRDTDTNVGQNGALIQLVFPEAYFADGEVIVGELNEFYQFRIIDEPVMEGPNAVYTVELMYGQESGISGARLQAGEKFSWEFAPVESELSRKAGGIRKSVPTSMRNEWTTIRKYHKFTGAADTQLRLDFEIEVDDHGKKRTIDSWFDNESWIFAQEWEKEKERARFYSRSNRNTNGSYMNYGKSGNVIKQGDGLIAQLYYGNTQFYNDFNENFSIKGLADAIYEICEQGSVPFSERKFVVLTGSRGLIQVNEAIMAETSGFSRVGNGSSMSVNADSLGVIKKTSNTAHDTSLSYGYQFTEWRGPNGLVLSFVYEPSLDDRERNKLAGPNNKGVLQSYAYYIFDMGSSAQPNMYLCKVKNKDDIFKYRIGIRNPWGIKNDNIISYDEDSAEIHVMTTLGACILDPTRCLSYLPAGLLG